MLFRSDHPRAEGGKDGLDLCRSDLLVYAGLDVELAVNLAFLNCRESVSAHYLALIAVLSRFFNWL